jgi:BirA family biotin operon repressor/biotin-[acetyl-CoA-carboxylase] ligase
MDALKALIKEGAGPGDVVVAERQTHGRGKQGRAWFSDEGSLTFSMLYRPAAPMSEGSEVCQDVGRVVADVVSAVTALTIRLEWPNDLIIDQEKVGGILIETASQGDKMQDLIVGVGLNVNTIEFPSALRHVATSLRLKLGAPVDTLQLRDQLIFALRHRQGGLKL